MLLLTGERKRTLPRMKWLGVTVIVAIGCFWLAACGITETVILRYPETGKKVECDPYGYFGHSNKGLVFLRTCVQDYQRQGYERAPE